MKTPLFTILASVLLSMSVQASATTYRHDFNSLAFSSFGQTSDLSGVNWTLEGNGQDSGLTWRPSVGQQLSSKNSDSYASEVVLSTSEITGTIKRVRVVAQSYYISTALLSVSVGDSDYGVPEKLMNAKEEFTFQGDSEGEIRIEFNQTSAGPIYITSVEVENEDGITLKDGDIYDFRFRTAEFNGYDTTAELGGVTWTLTGDGNAASLPYRPSVGQQLSLKDEDTYAKEVILSTSNIKGNIEKIVVTAQSYYISTAMVSVRVNGTECGQPAKLQNAKGNYEFEVGAEGEIELAFTQTTPGPIYLSEIQVIAPEVKTGIQQVDMDNNETGPEYYDLYGNRIRSEEFANGIIIEKTGNRTRKIMR